MEMLAGPAAFSTEEARVGYLARFYRGPALDWLSVKISKASYPGLSNFRVFVDDTKAAFDLEEEDQKVQARQQLLELQQKRTDLLLFLARFEALTEFLGIVSDYSRTTLLIPKLEGYYRNNLATTGSTNHNYKVVKSTLQHLYSNRAFVSTPANKPRNVGRDKKKPGAGPPTAPVKSGN